MKDKTHTHTAAFRRPFLMTATISFPFNGTISTVLIIINTDHITFPILSFLTCELVWFRLCEPFTNLKNRPPLLRRHTIECIQ
ncbi:Uncharacterised protein [Klebsiella quasipneumoniae]|nr:Uncharacterised protein [Klebsiella quasipneumoniae]